MLTLIVTEKGGTPKRMEFDKLEVTVGRVPGTDIVLPKGNVSKRHSRVVKQDGRFFVVDLKSTNGTYLNGRRITTPSVIRPGDKVYIGDFVIMGGGSAVHQFVRIGQHAFIGGLAGIENDVIPFGMAIGNRANLAGLNLIGLKRRNFTREAIHDLRRAYRLLFAPEGTLKERVEDIAEEFAAHPHVHEILDFIRAGGDRALCTPRDAKDAT
jgi:UDP-N-acetylglucosamine acyltransferase